jgi:hypothetical protein
MSRQGRQSLSERYKTEEKAYNRLLKQAGAKVIRWEYWDCLESRLPWHWEPSELCAQRMSGPRGLPKQISKERGYYYQYGYDARERVVILRLIINKRVSSEHIIRYADDNFAATTFCHHDELGVVLVCVGDGKLVNGRTVQLERAGEGKKRWMEVNWDGDQPTRLVFADQRGDKPSLEWLFTKGGKLISMHELPRKLPNGVNLNSLSKTIHDRMTKVIPEMVFKIRIREPAYCLILAYDGEGNGVMPPVLSIGLDSERQRILKQNPEEARRMIWNPDEFCHRLAKPRDLPTDKKLAKACEWFNRVLEAKGSDQAGRELLTRIAKDLAAHKWATHLPITDDFVVLAVDFEGADLQANLRKCVSGKILKTLRARRLA